MTESNVTDDEYQVFTWHKGMDQDAVLDGFWRGRRMWTARGPVFSTLSEAEQLRDEFLGLHERLTTKDYKVFRRTGATWTEVA